MNHSLVKLVDATLVPAAIMVVGKFLGLAITLTLFQMPWTILQAGEGFGLSSIAPAVNYQDLTTVSTYSDLILYVIMALGFSLVLIQVIYLQQHRITPSLLVKLSNSNLMGLVKSSYNIYHNATLWAVFIWITTATIAINTFLEKTQGWVLLLAVISSLVFTTIFLQDVYKEIHIARKTLGKQPAF